MSAGNATPMIPEEQFIRLFVRHEGELRAFASTLMPCPADAEDVVQDACVAMWQRIGDLENAQSFRAWAYTFVRFTALNKIRKQKRSPLLFSESLLETLAGEGEGESERARAEIKALTDCLDKLPPDQRELVSQYYHSAAIRMDDVARALQRNVAGLYKAMERTRHALRTCIEKRLVRDGFEVAEGGQ